MDHHIPYAAAALFLFLTISAVAGIVSDYKKRKLALESLRLAVDKGQALDPTVLDKLMQPHQPEKPLDPVHLKIGGIITTAAGVGLGVFSLLLAQVRPLALYPVLGVGALVVCVGIGLMISAAALRQRGIGGGS